MISHSLTPPNSFFHFSITHSESSSSLSLSSPAMSTRIHPSHHHHHQGQESMSKEKTQPCVLTVWKRSTMSFQGTDGFTVFDHHGKLAFRVDNYSRNNSTAILMDGAGNALLTLKPQIFSTQWNAYRGEGSCSSESDGAKAKPKAVFSMRSSGSMVFNGGGGGDKNHHHHEEAQVFMSGSSSSKRHGQGCKSHDETPDFKVQGCFRRRNCVIRNSMGHIAARISRKRVNKTVLLADDVFNLIVQPGFQPELIMAFVIVLDRIHTKHYYTPLLCS